LDDVDILGNDSDDDAVSTAALRLRCLVNSPRTAAKMTHPDTYNKKKRKQLHNDRLVEEHMPDYENPMFEEVR
jgi:hypothetical protein